MAIGKEGAAYRGLRVLFNVGVLGELSDGQLLERFATGPGDAAELAFAALVERHGSMVLRVCRGVLADPHEAQDAFQATFLVLVRKARSLWVRDSLGPWLHQVAYRAASGARATAARRGRLDRRAARPIEQSGPDPLDDLARALHEEIDRLPERYRAPVVLCDLEGRTHEQAARHLGWPIGTVKSRQSRARERLRERLSDRGLAPELGRLPLVPLPPALVGVTARVAARFLATRAIAPGSVATLAQGVFRSMIFLRCLKVGSALLALGTTTAGVAMLAKGGPSQEPDKPAVRPEGPTVTVGPGKIRLTVSGKGNVEATKVADLISEIEGGTTIIRILPEGSRVKEGDVVCELDSAALRDRLTTQRVTVHQAEASYQQSESSRRIAEVAVKEYAEGTFKQERDVLAFEIEMAQTGIAKAGARLDRSRLARKRLDEIRASGGPVNSSDILAELSLDDRLEDIELSLTRGRGSLLLAKQRLETLEKYTRDRVVQQLGVEVGRKRFEELARQNDWELEKSKDAKLERQIRACVLRAPANGILEYASSAAGQGASGQIEEGAMVRERQKIVRVVDVEAPMRLKVWIPEATVHLPKRGLKALVKVDALTNMTFDANVESVAPLPDPDALAKTGRKMYATYLGIGRSEVSLRPGMSAQFEILVSEADDVLTVPLSAVVLYDDKERVAVKSPGGGVEWRAVNLGMMGNDAVVEVKQGLKAGEVVSTDPQALLSEEVKRKSGAPTPPAAPR